MSGQLGASFHDVSFLELRLAADRIQRGTQQRTFLAHLGFLGRLSEKRLQRAIIMLGKGGQARSFQLCAPNNLVLQHGALKELLSERNALSSILNLLLNLALGSRGIGNPLNFLDHLVKVEIIIVSLLLHRLFLFSCFLFVLCDL